MNERRVVDDDGVVVANLSAVRVNSKHSAKERSPVEWEETANLEAIDVKGDCGIRNFSWRAPSGGSSLYGCIVGRGT